MKHKRTDVKIRIDATVLESTEAITGEKLARRFVAALDAMGITLHNGLDVTIIVRDGTLQGIRTTVKVPSLGRRR